MKICSAAMRFHQQSPGKKISVADNEISSAEFRHEDLLLSNEVSSAESRHEDLLRSR